MRTEQGERIAVLTAGQRVDSRGLRFSTAISPAPLTLPSHATLLTGLDPPEHGVRANGAFRLEDSDRPLITINMVPVPSMGGIRVPGAIGGRVNTSTLAVAITQRDLPILQGVIPLAVLIAVVMTLLADIVNMVLNPRLRLQST